MNHIKNLKYLKSNDIHFYIGWSILILGLILFVLGEFLWLYILPFQFFFEIGFIIIGAVVAFVPSVGRATEEELDNAIKTHNKNLCDKTTTALEKLMMHREDTPTVVGRYVLDGEGIIIRRGRRDQKYRSSLYKGAVIAFKKNSLYVMTTNLSLIDGQESESIIEFPYSAHPFATVEENFLDNLSKDGMRKREYHLEIKDDNNAISIPVENSVVIDELCEKLARLARAAR